MCYTKNKSSFIQVYRLNKVLTHQNIKGWWISKTKTYLAGLKKCFSFLSVNYAQRSCCKLHAPYNSLKKIFFQFLSIIYDQTHLRLGGTKKKLLPSSYSNGALKMCNICFCKYLSRDLRRSGERRRGNQDLILFIFSNILWEKIPLEW